MIVIIRKLHKFQFIIIFIQISLFFDYKEIME